jgi:hypothetical protein
MGIEGKGVKSKFIIAWDIKSIYKSRKLADINLEWFLVKSNVIFP